MIRIKALVWEGSQGLGSERGGATFRRFAWGCDGGCCCKVKFGLECEGQEGRVNQKMFDMCTTK